MDDIAFVGEIGKRFKIYTGLSLSNLSAASLLVEKPDGSAAVTWAANTLGAVENGLVYYDTIAGDLNISGTYRIYVKLVYLDGRTFFGKSTFFNVFNPSEG